MRDLAAAVSTQGGHITGLQDDVRSLRDELREAQKELRELVEPITQAIVGDNAIPGLRERVRDLERTRDNARWVLGIAVATGLGSIADIVVHWFRGHG